jgi:hypothetical protein
MPEAVRAEAGDTALALTSVAMLVDLVSDIAAKGKKAGGWQRRPDREDG